MADTVLFIFYLLFFLVLPSYCFLNLLRMDFGRDVLLNLSVILSIGIVATTFFLFLTRTSGLGFEIYWIVPILSVIYLIQKKYRKGSIGNLDIRHWKLNKTVLTVIVLCVFAQCYAILRGDVVTPVGHAYRSLNDSMWNISLIGELSNHTSPQNPTRSGEMLKNYHYFYHLQLAAVHSITKIPISILYFIFGPVLTSFLFGLGLYCVTKIFTSNIFFQGLSVFLGFFSGNFAYLIYFFYRTFDWKGNSFISDQPFDQIINTQSIMGYGLFLMAIYFLYLLINSGKKHNLNLILLLSITAGSLYGFKSFAGIIFLAGFFIISIYYCIIRKSLLFAFAWTATVMFFLPIFFVTTDFVHSYLHFAPFWILSQMVADEDKLNLKSLVEVEAYYNAVHNAAGLIKIRVIELLIYLFGNLGTRLLGFIYLIKTVIYDRSGHKEERVQGTSVFIFATIALLLPLSFNLGSNSYNIIQFTPYALVLYSIFTALTLEKIYGYLQKHNRANLGVILIIIVVLASIPVNIKNLISKFDIPTGVVTNDEYSALQYLKNNSKADAVILVDYRQYSGDSLYIPALSERKIYYATNDLASSTEKVPVLRDKISDNFFGNKLNRTEFLNTNNISYIYLRKPYEFDPSWSSNGLIMKKFYENGKVLILTI